MIKTKDNILICLLFKNGMLWLNRFINCINRLNELHEYIFHFAVVYGDSKDGTDNEIKRIMTEMSYKGFDINLIHLPLPRRLSGMEKLSILRNVVIYTNDVKKYDYIISMDTDIIFDNHVINKLIYDMQTNTTPDMKMSDIGIIAPLVLIDNTNSIFYDTWAFRMKGYMFSSYKPYIPRRIMKENPNFLNNNIENNRYNNIEKGNELIEVDSVGSFYICKSDIFWKWNIIYYTEKILDANMREQHNHREYESEQVCFCNSVRKKTGYKIYIDYGLNVYHINLNVYGLEWH